MKKWMEYTFYVVVGWCALDAAETIGVIASNPLRDLLREDGVETGPKAHMTKGD